MSCENCLKKQDEIEQYKTQWQNAEDSNIKLSEKILEYRKEIERLKEKLSTAEKSSTGYKKACDQYQEENESLTKKLSENEVRCCKGCPDCMGIGAREQLKGNQKEIQSLTARNKALEHIIYLGLVNGTVDYARWKSEAVRALESSKDYEDFKKSEKAMLETINQQGDEIKELKQALSGRTVSCEACNGMAEKIKELETRKEKSDSLRFLNEVNRDKKIKEPEFKIAVLESKLVGLIDQNGKLMIDNHDLKSKIAVLEKNKTYYVYEGSDLEAFELNRLESKLAVAREALKVFAERNPENDPYQPLAKKALAELGEKQ